MGNINTVGPNQALVVSGGCFGGRSKLVIGGWAWSWWLVSDVQRISLELMTITPKCEDVETSQGVPLTVTGVAQCKIMTQRDFLILAVEQFLSKDQSHIKNVISQTLEGHLRAILGTLTVEEIYTDRDKFAGLVCDVAKTEMARMGIEILSFTIKDVNDHVEYLASLGRARIAAVKRDALIGVAQAERDAGIAESECEKNSTDVKYAADTRVQDSNRLFLLKKAEFDGEVNAANAQAKLAYELSAAKMAQQIREQEMEIDVVERRKQIEIETREIERKEKELISTVKLPADSEAFRIQAIAEGKKIYNLEKAKAEAGRIKLIGSAEASAIEAVGNADAESMRLKAAAYKMYGEAAILSLTLDALPEIAAKVAAPLAKTDEIVLLGGSSATTSDISKLVTQMPAAVRALTGVDITGVLSKIPGATSVPQPVN